MTSLIFVSGDSAGAGKTTACLALLQLLVRPSSIGGGGFDPSHLGYIKPCTQCTDATIIWKYCKSKGIDCIGVGPVSYYKGFTYKVIDEESADVDPEALMQSIVQSVQRISHGKLVVLVDGVGYPSVGSCAGISNAQIAKELNASVVHIGKSGVGNAIDSLNLNLCYFDQFDVKVIGCIINRCPDPMDNDTRHTYDNIKRYVTKYFDKHRPSLKIFGFLPTFPALPSSPSCSLTTPTDLSLSFEESHSLKAFEAFAANHIDISSILKSL